MALNFPNSPTNGQLYTDAMSGNSWTWDSANTCWKSTSTYIQTITVASSAPGTPAVGQLWWNQDYGRLLVYYSDGTSSQWVDASPSDYTSGLAYGQANTVFGVANAAYGQANSFVGVYGVANAAFGKANTALQNTSGTFAGDLGVTGAVYAGGSSYSSTNNSISLNNGRIMLTKNDDWGMEMAGANGIRIRFYSSSGGQSSTVGSVQVDGTSAYYYTGNLYVYRQGIKFPATQESSTDANILDDYEEGTWTPTASTSSGAITSYTSFGHYVKIGKQVWIYAKITLTNVGTASGTLGWGGAPFINNSGAQVPTLVREESVSGIMNQGFIFNGQAGGNVLNRDNGNITWGNNYSHVFFITYIT